MSYKSLLVAAAIVLSPALAFADGATPAPSTVKADAAVSPAKTVADKTDKAGSSKTAVAVTDKTDKTATPVKTAAVIKMHKVHKVQKPKADTTTAPSVKPAG